MSTRALIKARRLQRQLDGRGHIARPHRGAEFPGDDVARVIIEDGGEIEPAPAGDFEIGKVGLPELVGRGGLVVELIGRLHHGERRAGDQAVCSQKPVNTGFRDEVGAFVCEGDGELARTELRLFQREVDELTTHLVRDAVPHAARA